MKFIGIIPSRYSSTRLPGKPLLLIHGKPMIQHVYERVIASKVCDKVLIATDDDRIYQAAKNFNAEVVLTSPNHNSGTERCAEAIIDFQNEFHVVINIQGDEPFISTQHIELLKEIFLHRDDAKIASLVKKINSESELNNPSVVKVVKSKANQALYFSRSPIPFARNAKKNNWIAQTDYFKHIGIYGYRSETLLKIASLSPTELEKTESLEQLRWLENGFNIQLAETAIETLSIDTPEDLKRANEISL